MPVFFYIDPEFAEDPNLMRVCVYVCWCVGVHVCVCLRVCAVCMLRVCACVCVYIFLSLYVSLSLSLCLSFVFSRHSFNSCHAPCAGCCCFRSMTLR